MATRSTISAVYPDGSVRSIYCHWDGYPENNGRLLQDHYQNWDKIQTLLDLGNLSSLAPEIGVLHNGDHRYCEFYGRDRGELGDEALEFASEDQFFSHSQTEEFNYFYRDGQWYLILEGRRLQPLSLVMNQIALEALK